jgi:hypothetical protein
LADDPAYGPTDTVTVNAQRFSGFLDAVVGLVSSETTGLAALRKRIDDLENPPAPTNVLTYQGQNLTYQGEPLTYGANA